MPKREIVINVEARRYRAWIKVDGKFYAEPSMATPRICAWLDEQGIPHFSVPLGSTIERDGGEWTARIFTEPKRVDPDDDTRALMIDVRRSIVSEPPADLEVSEVSCVRQNVQQA